MPRYRNPLPQLADDVFLTDGGIETTLIFHDGWDLPHFAAFDLLRREGGTAALTKYFASYVEVARRRGLGVVLESPTWRASSGWGHRLGYGDDDLAEANRRSVGLLASLREEHEAAAAPIVLSGCVGPRGDGYDPGEVMEPDEARSYHRAQIATLGSTEADLVTAITMTSSNEALGVARAAEDAEMPAVISFTVETDGRLPTGETLEEAIGRVDEGSGSPPVYYMINCAHPTHFAHVLAPGTPWADRIRGLRANASRMSHAELDEAPELDPGDPVELADDYRRLTARLPRLTVLGGCCGTDPRHIDEIAAACGSRAAIAG